MYVDYDFYSTTYSGIISNNEFTKLEIQASSIVDFYTFNRIDKTDVSEKVKFAVCELVDYLKELKAAGGKEIASESVGSHSVSYVTNNTSSEDKKYSIVKKYLGHTGLMYRGV